MSAELVTPLFLLAQYPNRTKEAMHRLNTFGFLANLWTVFYQHRQGTRIAAQALAQLQSYRQRLTTRSLGAY